MSLQPINYTQHIFTSTLTDHKPRVGGFNVWIVLLTAFFFFTILGWFNFALAFYGTISTTDPNHNDQTIHTLGFAIMWTIIAIAMYYTMDYTGVLGGRELSDDEHPLLKGEERSDVSNVGVESRYVGDLDMAAI